MKKIKQFLGRLIIMTIAAGGMWIVSFLPSGLLNVVGAVSLGLALLLFLYVCVVYRKQMKKALSLVVLCCVAFPVLGRSIEECDKYDAASVEEGNYCRYEVFVSEFGKDICGYMKSFDPSSVKTGSDATELQETVNNADKIVQAYEDLNDAYQNSVSGSCKVLTPEDEGKSLKDRLKILSDNNNPLCCAWAMQSKYQIYTAKNGERQVETVPMMLANEKLQCWPCDVVYLLITLANTMAYRAAPAMAAVGLFFLKWMLIFWLVIKIGCLFVNRNMDGKPYDATMFMKELFARVCWAMIAALIISDTAAQLNDKTVTNMTNVDTTRSETLLDQTYQQIINPPFEMIATTGIEIARALIRGENSFYGKVAQAVDAQQDASVRVYGSAMQKTDYCSANGSVKNSPMYQHITRGGVSSGYKLDVASQGRAISDDTTRDLLCLTQLSFQGLAPISAAGSIITTHAIKNSWGLPFPLPGSFPVIPQLWYGFVLMVVCWLTSVAVGFRLIDIMIRVAMVLLLGPIFIVAAVFPLTRDKAKTAVVFFVSAVMGFIEVAIAIGISVPCFYRAIANNGNEKELINAMVAPSTSHYVPDLYEQFSASGAKFFLYIAVVGWMCFKLMTTVASFFEKVFSLKNVGKIGAGKTGTMAGILTDVRQGIGEMYDTGARIIKKSEPYKDLAVAKHQNKVNAKAAQRRASGTPSAGQRFFNSKTGQATLDVYNAGKKAVDVTKEKANQVKEFAKNNKLTRGVQALGNTKVGQAAKFLVNNRLTRAMAKGLKGAPKFAKDQLKQGVKNFFHPKDE